MPGEPSGTERVAHVAEETERALDAERHATNLELFLDLVFVFAVTQLTAILGGDLSWAGAGRTLLLAWLVWWQWSQFTWAGAAVDLQRRAGTRALVLCTIPATLAMTTALPGAYGDAGEWFGAAYLLVQLLVLAMQGSEALAVPEQRVAFVRYASVAAIAPLLVLGGSFLDEPLRIALWSAAAVINVVGALRAATSEGEWAVNPVHFAERHALFVIIALGEALVAVGSKATEYGLSASVALGLAASAGGACVLWWGYFAFLPEVVEHRLRAARGSKRGAIARDLFTFGHFPIVAGIVCYAVVVKHVVPHAGAAMSVADRATLVAAAAALLGAYIHLEARVLGGRAVERWLALGLVAGWCALADSVPGGGVVAVVMLVLAGSHAISLRRYSNRSPGPQRYMSTNTS